MMVVLGMVVMVVMGVAGGCESTPPGGGGLGGGAGGAAGGEASGGSGGRDVLRGLDPAAAYAAFAPSRVRVHPLTHVDGEGGTGGRGVLVLHFEVRDRFGDAIKGLGVLRVELYRPGPGVMQGMETREGAWTVAELADAEGNSARWDRTTRTYRVQLFAPEWVRAWSRGDAREREGTPWVKVRVLYTVLDEAGEEKVLTDEYVLQG
jgi:hypothetical protein